MVPSLASQTEGKRNRIRAQNRNDVLYLHEKTRAAAAPRKLKNGAVSSPLNADDIFLS